MDSFAERAINRILGLVVLLPIAGIIAVTTVILLSELLRIEKHPSIISVIAMVIGLKTVYMSENAGKKVRKFLKEKIHNGLLKNLSEETKVFFYVMIPIMTALILSLVMIVTSL